MTYSKHIRVSLAALLLAAPAMTGISAVADIVQADDVIIQFSLCVGNDCVNGESFGFDTIRLKENNLRIKFDDTSAAASFPANDWEITVNDSGNGGANYFAVTDVTGGRVPFRVDAGAPTNSLYVDSSGDVGFGTATPVVKAHAVSGNSPTLRLEQNGSSGFTPQTFDIAANEANFFIRDVTNGSQLPFRIFPGADTNALTVSANNRVGMGIQTAQAALHVRAFSGDKAALLLDGGSASTPTNSQWEFSVRNSDGELAMNDASTGGGDFIFKTADTGANTPWEFIHRADNGLGINTGSSAGGDFILDTSGNLRILGTITSGGPTCAAGCDAVFDADYDLPTIEEQAEAMFAKRHLPTVGPTSADNPINLTEHMGNVLNELEKAHIFIAQLNERNKALETELSDQRSSFEARLQQIEQSID